VYTFHCNCNLKDLGGSGVFNLIRLFQCD
jgi:hypothetical protein